MADHNRLEREIEEILGKIEQFPDATARKKRERNRTLQRISNAIADRQRALMRQLSRFTIAQVILLSIIVILGSLFFRRAAPQLMTWVLTAGIILFVTALAISFFGNRRGASGQPNWRGRPVRPATSGGPTIPQRLQRWWTARTRR
ncbi:MAG: hypothetical protein DWI58_20185 [Chloroflexi bacterium]|nr:MAG: hypothetical protein DWI58_20185 [Chloroflexota bacterium]